MTQQKSASKIIFSVASIFLLTVFFNVAFCVAYNFEYEIDLIIISSFVTSGLTAVYYLLQNSGKVIFISVVVVIILFWILTIPDFTSYFQEFIYWFIDYAEGNAGEDEQYINLTKRIAFALILINAVFLQSNITRRLSCFIITLGMLCFCGYYEYDIPRIIISFALVYEVLVMIEVGLRYTQKQKDESKRLEVLSRLAPIVVAVVLISNILPAPSDPLEWGGARSAYKFLKAQVNNIAGDLGIIDKDKDNDKTIGFSDGIELGGNINNDKTVAFEVTFNNIPQQNIYIKGAVSDTYKNNGWIRKYNDNVKWGSNANEVIDEYVADYAELYYSIIRSGFFYTADSFVKSYATRIGYKGLKTNCVLYSSRVGTEVEFDSFVNTKGPVWLFNEQQGKDTTYTFAFSDLFQLDRTFINLVNDQKNFKYSAQKDSYNLYTQKQIEEGSAQEMYMDSSTVIEYIKQAYNLSFENCPSNLDNLLDKRAATIRRQYLDVPKSVPDRVAKLAKEITKGAKTDYDKLKALESYLVANYKYTVKPGTIPNGKDAVDYFLFEKNSGYCTYFASAMAIMGRSLGIPTRIAQGYIVKAEPFNAKYDVTENDAHAWVEGYIEGLGWVNFEPTAGFVYDATGSSSKTDSSSRPESKPDSSSQQSSSTPDSSSSITDSSDASSDDTAIDSNGSSKNGGTIELKNTGGRILWLLIIIAVLVILLTPLIEYVKINIIFIKYGRLYKSADNNLKVYMDITALIKLLESKKLKLEEFETLSEYSSRINCYNPKVNDSIKESFDVYMKERYGGIDINSVEQKKVEMTRQLVESYIKDEISAFKYFRLSYNTTKSGYKRFK